MVNVEHSIEGVPALSLCFRVVFRKVILFYPKQKNIVKWLETKLNKYYKTRAIKYTKNKLIWLLFLLEPADNGAVDCDVTTSNMFPRSWLVAHNPNIELRTIQLDEPLLPTLRCQQSTALWASSTVNKYTINTHKWNCDRLHKSLRTDGWAS